MKNVIDKYIEKKIRKYVVATIDGKYLKKNVLKGKYSFIDDIEVATKTLNYETMKDVLRYFYYDTNMNDLELIILPIDITYELINENGQMM